MNFQTYQQAAHATAIYPRESALTYLALGLAGEAGEVANKVKKVLRDKIPIDHDAIAAELGDVLWYVAELAGAIGFDLTQIAERNLLKLQARATANTLRGEGDKR